MKTWFLAALFASVTCYPLAGAVAEAGDKQNVVLPTAGTLGADIRASRRLSLTKSGSPIHAPYRGWSYLAQKLRQEGISEQAIRAVYYDKRMPYFSFIPFALSPREGHAMYRRFLQEQTLQVGRSFLKRHEYTFQKAEKSFRVSRYVVAALLLIETHVGKNTGKDLVINRLSRLASVGDPDNLVLNYQRLAKEDPTVTIEAVQARAQYLEDTFFPEVRALFEMKLEKRMNLFELRGSSAGAFGLPQFLPSNFLRFGVDANRDGVTSLFHEEDAILSTANFLSHHGWHDDAPKEEQRKVLWKYNRSDAYVEAAINVAERLR